MHHVGWSYIPLNLKKQQADVASTCRICIPLAPKQVPLVDAFNIYEEKGRVHFFRALNLEVLVTPVNQVESEVVRASQGNIQELLTQRTG